jgi:hypothetical protein
MNQMKTDPRKACANTKEKLFWAIVHDLIAHALMALTLYSSASVRFHNWTSLRAWPRPSKPVLESDWVAELISGQEVVISNVSPGVYSISHPTMAHKLVTNAEGKQDALRKGLRWFRNLSVDFPEFTI